MYDTNSNDSLYACYEDETPHTSYKTCPKRRYYYAKNDGRCNNDRRPVRSDDGGRSCRKCCDRCCGTNSSSAFAAVSRWTRAAIHWILDKKSHIIVAAVSFVLGVFFGDYCNCLYYAADGPQNGC